MSQFQPGDDMPGKSPSMTLTKLFSFILLGVTMLIWNVSCLDIIFVVIKFYFQLLVTKYKWLLCIKSNDLLKKQGHMSVLQQYFSL